MKMAHEMVLDKVLDKIPAKVRDKVVGRKLDGKHQQFLNDVRDRDLDVI